MRDRSLGSIVLVTILGCSLGRPSTSAAQVNIESLRREALSPGASGSVRLDLTARTGNVSLLQLALAGRADLLGRTVHTLFIGQGDLGFQGGARFANAGLAHLRQTYLTGGRVEPEAFLQINYDRQQRLAFRALAGGGVRVAVRRTSHVRLWFGSGAMFEHERLDLPPTATHPRQTDVVRSSSYLSARAQASLAVRIILTSYLQPQIDAPEDLRFLTNLALAVTVTDAVSLVTSFNLRYDSRPPDATRPLDTALRTGVSVAF